jgi:hypothetical protein
MLIGKHAGYSWPPHLYQGLFKLEEITRSVNARIAKRLSCLCALCAFAAMR